MGKEYLETRNYQIIKYAIELSFKHTGIILIVGHPGTGKTFCSKAISQIYKGVFLVTMESTMSLTDFFNDLCEVFGVEYNERERPHILAKRIAGKINQDSSRKVILIDECTFLMAPMLPFIHQIFNKTDDKLGIILLGPKNYTKRLSKWRESSDGIDEFCGRILTSFLLESPSSKEIEEICKLEKVTESDFIDNAKRTIRDFRTLDQQINLHKTKTKKIEIPGLELRDSNNKE